MLPTIADFFGISIDRLMGVDEAAEKSKAAQYTSRFQDAVSQGRIDDCISIARNGVAEYPNNYELLNRLMYVLFLSGDSDGNIPEWQENMQKYDSEITMLGERIMKYCPDQNIRLEAVGRLAFQHCSKARWYREKQIFETTDSRTLCKIMRDKWLASEDFDGVRDAERFKDILRSLSA